MKSRENSRSKTGPFSLDCTDPYIGIGWEYQSTGIGLQYELEKLENLAVDL